MTDLVAIFRAERSGAHWIAKCPAHQDDKASLSISKGDDGRWLVKCFAGCNTANVLSMVGLTFADIQPDNAVNRRPSAEYSYRDFNGNEVFQVVRFEPKDFRQRHRDPVTNKWVYNTRGIQKVLYKLPQLKGKPSVFIVEGEKDADTLWALGLPATTNAGGAGKWSEAYTLQLVQAGVRKVAILPDNDDPGRQHAERIAAACSRDEIEARVVMLPGLPPKGDVSDWLQTHSKDDLLKATQEAELSTSADPLRAGRRVKLTSASQVKIAPVKWLWSTEGQGRIPAGCLSLIAGREGIGKSLFAIQTLADLTRGELEGAFYGTPKHVIVAATEDSLTHTLVPRLMAAGADLERVHFAEMETPEGQVDELVLPRDIAEIEATILEYQPAALVLDPLISRLAAGLDTHRDADTRRGLEPLVALAGRANITILGLIHLSKANTTDPLTQIMGSKAFAAVARAVIYCMVDPDDDDIRLVGQAKNNLGRMDIPALSYKVTSKLVQQGPDGDIRAGKIEWCGPVERSIREAVYEAQTAPPIEKSAVEAAESWLLHYLSNKALASQEVKKAARAAGHAERTLKRAFRKLNGMKQDMGWPRETYWSLGSSSTGTYN